MLAQPGLVQTEAMQDADVTAVRQPDMDCAEGQVLHTTFVDLVYSVPHLIIVMTPACWGTLLATSSILRQHLRQQVRKLWLSPLYKYGWRHLRTLPGAERLLVKDSGAVAQLRRGTLPLLQILAHTKLSTQGFASLSFGDWPLLQELNLTNTGSMGENWEQLRHGKWPMLHSLLLGDSAFACHAITAQPDWPLLQKLLFASSTVSNGAMQQLINYKWLQLESIQFRCCHLDDQALSILSKASWPKLKFLALDHNEFGPQGIASLVQADVPCLQGLCLLNVLLDALGHLQQSHWPKMESVSLGCKHWVCPPMQVERIVPLFRLQWAGLCHLFLVGISLQQDSTSQDCSRLLVVELIKAKWPLLQTLSLDGGSFTAQATAELARGRWPLLERLEIFQMLDLDEGIARSLVLGEWPNMQYLSLSKKRQAHPAAQHGTDYDMRSDLTKHKLGKPVFERWPDLKVFKVTENHFM